MALGLYKKSKKPTSDEEELRIQELLRWQPPAEMKKRFCYYLSGKDKEGYPVWIIELGNWDVKSFIEECGPMVADFEKFVERMFHVMQRSPQSYPGTTDKFTMIYDLTGYSARQLTSYKSVQKSVALAKLVGAIIPSVDNLKFCTIVNGNAIFQSLWKILGPAIGPFADKIEIHGSGPEKWKPVLLELIDSEQLPPSLGGTKNLNQTHQNGENTF